MFRPSQNLLFRPMPALNKLKIHQPLPLTPRESQQLLNILTTSFRKHLDVEHGHFDFDLDNVPRPHQQSSTASIPKRRRNSDYTSHPTDSHMHSLLTNPLFSLPPNKRKSKPFSNPMDLFDQAVAKGMMTTHYAYICLVNLKREIILSPTLDIRDGMKDSGAGLKVLKWLTSSGMANNNDFLKDGPFAGLFMQFLVAEGLQEVAWAWIKRSLEARQEIYKLQGSARFKARQDVIRPLMCLLSAQAGSTRGPAVPLESSYICLSRAAGYFESASIAEMRQFLAPAGLFLAHRTIFGPRKPLSESSFESFLSLVPIISRDSDYFFAHLNVLHPTEPTPDLALNFLSQHMVSTPETLQAIDGIPKDKQARYRIQLCLDTAKLLLETKRSSEAHRVMDYLRTNYPKPLGVEENRQLEQAKAEASSLELLEGLSLA
jgi:hypothetical protein